MLYTAWYTDIKTMSDIAFSISVVKVTEARLIV